MSPAGKWQPVIDVAESLMNATLQRANAALQRGDLEAALQWLQTLGGFVAHGGTFGRLVSPEAERLALNIAEQVAEPSVPSAKDHAHSAPHRVLHVLTEAWSHQALPEVDRTGC